MSLDNPHIQATLDPQDAGLPYGPIIDTIPVTPHDSDPVDERCGAIYIETAGRLDYYPKGREGTLRQIDLDRGWHPLAPGWILTSSTASGIFVCI